MTFPAMDTIHNDILPIYITDLCDQVRRIFCILEIPGSNRGPETGYPNVFCTLLTLSSHIPKLGYNCIHPQLFQFLIHYHPTI